MFGFARIKIWTGAALALVAALVAANLYIRADERAKIQAKQAEQYIEGTKDVTDALSDLPDNPVDGLRGLTFGGAR